METLNRVCSHGAKLLMAIFLLGLTAALSCAAQGAPAFNELFGQRGAGFIGRDVEPTSDGGTIFVGLRAATAHDIQVLKLDPNGAATWQRSYAVGGQPTDGYRIAQTSTGYVVMGARSSATGTGQLLVLTLDAEGNPLWQASYSAVIGSTGIFPYSVDPTSDGGYVIGANTYDRLPFWVLKLDRAGSIEWQKSFGFIAGSVHPSADGGYIVAGSAPCEPNCTPSIVKLDGAGGIVWQKQYLIDSASSFVQSARQTEDGGYLVAGGYNPSPDLDNGWLMKLDTAGSLIWQQAYASGCFAGIDVFDARPTLAGGYLMMFTSPCAGALTGVAQLAADGTIQWQEALANLPASPPLTIDAIAPTPDGGFIATGEVGSKLLAMKADGTGSLGACPNVTLQSPQLVLVSPPATQEVAADIPVKVTNSVPLFRKVISLATNLSPSDGCEP